MNNLPATHEHTDETRHFTVDADDLAAALGLPGSGWELTTGKQDNGTRTVHLVLTRRTKP